MFGRLIAGSVVVLLLIGAQALLPLPDSQLATAEASRGSITVNVRHYGASGDGTHDDSRAIERAISAAAKRPGSTVYFPRGVYFCSTPIRLGDHVNLRGRGVSASWLKGRLEFGSYSRVGKLKIGDAGRSALTNASGARGTTFSDCRFHGGGSSGGLNGAVVYLGGSQGNVSEVLFARCEIERTSYVPPPGVDAYANGVGNTITINEFTHEPNSGHVEGITFRDCHLGASNGSATGALRMMMEAYSWDGRTGLAYHGWKDLTFDHCLIEASDTTGLDFADNLLTADPTRHSASGVTITNNTFLGARRDETYDHGGLPIIYECPTGIVIKNNLFYASPHEAIGGSWVREGVTTAPALLIEGNTFDMTSSPSGQTHERGEPCISLVGYNSRIINNTFLYDAGWGVLIQGGAGHTVFGAVGNLVQGNTFTDRRTTGGEPTILLGDDGAGCYDNRITGNTIHNHAAGTAGVITQSSGSGTNYATDNLIDCGSALPFVVRSGVLVQTGNTIQ